MPTVLMLVARLGSVAAPGVRSGTLPGATLLLSFLVAVVGFGLAMVGVRGLRQAIPRFRLASRVRRATERTTSALAAPPDAEDAEGGDAAGDGHAPAPLSAPPRVASLVAVRGIAALVEEGVPIDPLGGRPCVAYRLVIDRVPAHRRVPMWEVLIHDAEVRPFVLRDGHGAARVVPGESPHVEFLNVSYEPHRGAPDARLLAVLSRYGLDQEAIGQVLRTRTEHAAIEVGAEVVAIGAVRAGENGHPMLTASDDTPLILAELSARTPIASLAFSLTRPLLLALVQLAAGGVCVAQLLLLLFS